MEWIKLENQLPPKNTLVLVKRFENKIEEEPVYFAMRQDEELSINKDASKNCFWWGTHKDLFLKENESYSGLNMNSNFSDVTVKEWAFINIDFLS